MNQFQQFAPPASSPGVCAKGGRRSPSSLASAATFDHAKQGSADTALGLRWGMCRPTRALRTTGRFGGLGCSISYYGRCFGIGRLFARRANGGGCSRPVAVIHRSRQSHFQCVSKADPSHFEISDPNASKPSEGIRGHVQNSRGGRPQVEGVFHVGNG